MKDRPKRLSVADQIRKGLGAAIRHAKGEMILKTTVIELPDRPPEVRAEDVPGSGSTLGRNMAR